MQPPHRTTSRANDVTASSRRADDAGDPLRDKDLAAEALGLVADAASGYLDSLHQRPVTDEKGRELLGELDGPLPERGVGTVDSVRELVRIGTEAATNSSGPRFFHFVVGGSTPAAMAGDCPLTTHRPPPSTPTVSTHARHTS